MLEVTTQRSRKCERAKLSKAIADGLLHEKRHVYRTGRSKSNVHILVRLLRAIWMIRLLRDENSRRRKRNKHTLDNQG